MGNHNRSGMLITSSIRTKRRAVTITITTIVTAMSTKIVITSMQIIQTSTTKIY